MRISQKAIDFIKETQTELPDTAIIILENTKEVCCGTKIVPDVLLANESIASANSNFIKKENPINVPIYIESKYESIWETLEIECIGAGFRRYLKCIS